MTNELFSPLFSLGQSLLAYMLVLSLQLLVIMLLRKPVARHFGAVTAYRLWALPLLLLPFYWINLPAVDWNTLRHLLPAGGESAQGIVSWAPQMLKELDFELALPALETLTLANGWSFWLWLSVICIWLGMAGLLVLLQIRQIRKFASGLSLLASGQTCAETNLPGLSSLPVNYLQGLGSPALFGVFRPRLLLPSDFEQRYDAEQRALILRHEAVHLQRHDNLWNLLATLLRLLFWFNPILHLVWKRFRLDQELSCDERVLQEANPEQGRQYARMLLESMSNGLEFRHQPTITAWGNLREIRERTHMIRYHINKKPRHRAGKWLLLCAVLCGSLLTAIHNEGFREVVAADDNSRPANVLTREVYERIERVQELRDQADYEIALEVMDELLAMYDQGEMNHYEAYMMFMFYGSISMEQGNFTQSIDYWNNAYEIAEAELEPENSTTILRTLGQLYYVEEDYSAAIEHFMRYVELEESPGSNVHLQIGTAYYQLERYEDAIPWAEQAIELREDLNGYRFLHSLYVETGREEEAQKVLQIIEERADEFVQDDIVPESVRLSRSEYLPTVTVPPRYPNEALTEGVEGWVQVEFTVNEQGEVIDPVVVDAEPGGYFEESSLAAIRRFRYEPKEENGTPVATENVQYVFTYRLTE